MPKRKNRLDIISLYDLDVLHKMQTIDLSQMKSVKLMNRVDTKFIANIDKLPALLNNSMDSYYVQVIQSCPISSYETLYYDTDDLDMYIRHNNKQLKRQKIRSRIYVESKIAFIEIKNKSNKGRTSKERIEIPLECFQNILQDEQASAFIDENANYDVAHLSPSLETSFKRITMTNKEKTERLTIDTDLQFHNMRTNKVVSFPKLMIIELKQDSTTYSHMKTILSDLRIMPTKISKYCIGVAFTDPLIKKNRFKVKMRLVDKIINNKYIYK